VQVAPKAEFLSAVNITVGHVHSSDIAYFVVDDAYLAVIAPVDVGCELRHGELHEGFGLDAGFFQTPEKPGLDMKRPDVVVQQTYADSGTRALNENVGDTRTKDIVVEDVVLDVYCAACIGEISLEGREFVAAVIEDLDRISAIELRAGYGAGHNNLLNRGIAEAGMAHIEFHALLATAETAPVAPRNHALVLDIAAKEDVQGQTDDGDKQQDGDPSEAFDGIAVFRKNHDDDDNGRAQRKNSKRREKPVGSQHVKEFGHKRQITAIPACSSPAGV